jgi:hypothetical protein
MSMCIGFVWLRITHWRCALGPVLSPSTYRSVCVCGDEHGGKLAMTLLNDDESLLVQ